MKALILALAAALASSADAKELRSNVVRNAFVKANPCPVTGQPRLPCKGYIIDHITPLCAGGQDHPSNMQWQTVAEAKEKDKEEWRLCREKKGSSF